MNDYYSHQHYYQHYYLIHSLTHYYTSLLSSHPFFSWAGQTSVLPILTGLRGLGRQEKIRERLRGTKTATDDDDHPPICLPSPPPSRLCFL